MSTPELIIARNRTASDALSGLSLNEAEYPAYPPDELVSHFTTFSAYDLDSSGFISPENLLEVLTAMEVKGANMEMVKLIIDEVAILVGHDNDGKLSFRDYMRCIEYDAEAAKNNLALDALEELGVVQEELRESLRESAREESGREEAVPGVSDPPPAEASEAPAEQPQGRMRQSSMAAVAAVAALRIKAFQQKCTEAQAAQDKLSAFKTKPVELGPMVNSDEMHKETLRNKVKAFETAASFTGKVEMKKTWKQVGSSRYLSKTKIYAANAPAGPPPKKNLSELP